MAMAVEVIGDLNNNHLGVTLNMDDKDLGILKEVTHSHFRNTNNITQVVVESTQGQEIYSRNSQHPARVEWPS